jgi:hypothetical protein
MGSHEQETGKAHRARSLSQPVPFLTRLAPPLPPYADLSSHRPPSHLPLTSHSSARRCHHRRQSNWRPSMVSFMGKLILAADDESAKLLLPSPSVGLA